MNWVIMQLTCDRSSLFVSSALSTLIFTLIGKYFFWSCYTNLVSKSGYKNKKMLLSRFRGYLGEIESDCRTVWTYIFLCIIIVRVTTTCHVCWYLAERRWLPWLRVSKRSVRLGSGCSEMSGAKDSKAVLSCEWPEERSAFACRFVARKR